MSDNEEERRARKRARTKQLKEDLRALQNQLREAQEAQQQANEQNAALQLQLGNHQDQEPNQDHREGDPKPSKSDIKFWQKAATVAGRRAAALHAPFLDADMLTDHRVQNNFAQILDRVQRSKDPDDELEDADDPAKYWDQPRFGLPGSVDLVEELIFHLPKSPGQWWFEEWFQHAIQLGIRKMRGDIVHAVAREYEAIFEIHDPAFRDRKNRPDLPEVQALMASFMHLGEEDENQELDLSRFFRDSCIVRVIRLLLNGPKATHSGTRSSKARKPHAKMWHVTKITASLLAFAATVIKFVLSGEPSFEEVGPSINYTEWFFARLHILQEVYEAQPNAYHDLIKFYNRSVLPDIHRDDEDHAPEGGVQRQDNAGMSAEDDEFVHRLRGGN